MKLTSLLLFLLLCHMGFSQDTYHAEWFSADSNHLPQNSVKSITPDKYGYIWLSTENGIVRYDGLNFKTFNSESIKGLNSNRMLLFTGNIKKDSIIILNSLSETLLIHNRTVKILDTVVSRKKLHKLLSRDIYFRNRNNYLPQKGKPIAFSVKDKTYQFTQDSVSVYNSNYKLTVQKKYTHEDSLRFFVSSGNLYMLNKQNEFSLFSEIHQSYQKFGPDFTKKIKIYTNDTNKGLLVVKRNDFKHNATSYHHNTGSDDVYYALAKFSDTKIVSSTGELFDVNGQTEIIGIGDYTDKFMLIIDNNGDMWTKESAHLYRFSKKSNFKEYTKWTLIHPISCLSKGVDGKIFIGTYNSNHQKGDLYSIDPKEQTPSPKAIMKLNFYLSVLAALDTQTLWCGSEQGLYKINVATKKIKQYKSFNKSIVRNIYTPNKNEAWIGSYNNGFFLYRNEKITHLPTDRNGYLSSSHCILEDKKGYMWITTNRGLFSVKKQDIYDYADNKTKNIYYHFYDRTSGFLNNEFNGGCNSCGINLHNKTFFFPSMDGVVYFNPDDVKKPQPTNGIYLDYTEADSLSYTNNDSLVFDRNFGKIKFFISSPFFGNTYNQNIETRLEGPVTQGWTPMTENNVSFSTLPPGEYKLKIRKLSGFGSKYICKDYHFSVTPAFWQTRWFTILLIALGIYITYLSYKLRVRYIKHKNIQLEKQVVLRTQQLQTTVVTLRKTKDDLNVQVLNHKKLIKTITHDIKSPLKFIAITGRYLYNNLEKSLPISKEDIKAIHTSSTQLYHFVDNFLEYAKETDLENNESQPYSLHMLADEKLSFFKNIAAAAKTKLINKTDARLFITVNRHLLSIILHNLLDNALKNTFSGTITVSAIAENDVLSINVADTGAGMKPEIVSYYMSLSEETTIPTKQNGMGLHMITELLTITGGKLHINSQEGSGTTITLTFTQIA
jgi:signal transduction histidine kinase/ligand-binding sensor domain-containing protein